MHRLQELVRLYRQGDRPRADDTRDSRNTFAASALGVTAESNSTSSVAPSAVSVAETMLTGVGPSPTALAPAPGRQAASRAMGRTARNRCTGAIGV